jgi:hypothetical protein
MDETIKKHAIRKVEEVKSENLEGDRVEEVADATSSDGKKKSGKDVTNVAALLLVFVVLVVGSILAYNAWFRPDPIVETTESYEFNGFLFEKQGPLWVTNIKWGGEYLRIPMHYGPTDTKHITLAGRLNDTFNEGPLYITFEPDADNVSSMAIAAAELSLNLAQGINRSLVAACSRNVTEACATRPIVDCRDTDKAVIYLKENDVPFIKLEDNCIVIYGKGNDLLKGVDRLLMFWYGVVQARKS